MQVNRTVKYTVNMGQYESFQFGAEVSLHHGDLGLSEEDVANMSNEELADLHENLINKANNLVRYTVRDEVSRVKTHAPNTSKAKNLLA